MPSPGILNPSFFNNGPDVSSKEINKNLTTINVKYKGSKVARPANNFDLKFCVIEFIIIKI